MRNQPNETNLFADRRGKILLAGLIGLIFTVYFFSNPHPLNHFDYTFRVAENMLDGAIGFAAQPPSWLNEFVAFKGLYYSVFPLGAVLTMLPFAFLKFAGIVSEMPASFIAAAAAGVVGWFTLKIGINYDVELKKVVLVSAAILCGSWMWTNLTMAGAWQLALGWAMVGEFGAIYFTVYRRRPLLAGFFFALAFGNRTEILLTAPIFIYLLRENFSEQTTAKDIADDFRWFADGGKFCLAPLVLGAATLGYNILRFGSITDFGYARIPGVLNEPWYRDGIFSVYYVPLNAAEMLWTFWKPSSEFPYLVPTGFGGSILLSSPFLLLSLRFGAVRNKLKYAAWTAIVTLTVLLWTHGNPGGWQFSYRYAMILLPWFFVILLENGGRKISPLEWFLYVFSIVVNAWATYLFFWTDYVKP